MQCISFYTFPHQIVLEAHLIVVLSKVALTSVIALFNMCMMKSTVIIVLTELVRAVV